MSFKARKNQKYLLELMSKIIDEVEDETSNYLKPSCKKDVIEAAKSLLKKSKNEAGEWDNDFDYEKTANVLLYNISAKLLQSGKFVLVPGVLNPLSPAHNLYAVFCHSIDYAVSKGEVDEEWKKEVTSMLWNNIKNL